jgi:hypothetical protein
MTKRTPRSAPDSSVQEFNDVFDQSGAGRQFNAQNRRGPSDLPDGGFQEDLWRAGEITGEHAFFRAAYLAGCYGFWDETARRHLNKLYEMLPDKKIGAGIDRELQRQRERGVRKSFRAATRAYAIPRLRAGELAAHSAEALQKSLERKYRAAKQRACEFKEKQLAPRVFSKVLVAPLRFPLLEELRNLRIKFSDLRCSQELQLEEIERQCEALYLELHKLEDHVASATCQAVLLDGFWVANNKDVREAIDTRHVLVLDEAHIWRGWEPAPEFDIHFYWELARLANGPPEHYEAFVAAIRAPQAGP